VNPINELLEAVDALTKPVKNAVMQHAVESDGKNARPEGIRARQDAHLLEQLRQAITSNIGGIGGAGKAARERTPLDVAAFQLYEAIDGRARAWLLDCGVRPSSAADAAEVIRRWYVLWKVKPKEDAAITAHTAILARWATQIRDLLDPPTKQELTVHCPVCGNMWATIGTGEETESVRALWAFWRENPDDSYALCRSCDKVWAGVGMMRRLRIQIDDVEQAREAVNA
jgi:hypothetical protein